MGVKERKARQKKFLRQEILDAASELFVKEGYEDVSMRRIAEKIEYSPTAIYVHFRDKQQLFLELCHCDYRRLADLGVTTILTMPWALYGDDPTSLDAKRRGLERFAEEIIQKVR